MILLRQFNDWGKTELLEVAIDRAQICSVQQSLDAICCSPSFWAKLGTSYRYAMSTGGRRKIWRMPCRISAKYLTKKVREGKLRAAYRGTII